MKCKHLFKKIKIKVMVSDTDFVCECGYLVPQEEYWDKARAAKCCTYCKHPYKNHKYYSMEEYCDVDGCGCKTRFFQDKEYIESKGKINEL